MSGLTRVPRRGPELGRAGQAGAGPPMSDRSAHTQAAPPEVKDRTGRHWSRGRGLSGVAGTPAVAPLPPCVTVMLALVTDHGPSLLLHPLPLGTARSPRE